MKRFLKYIILSAAAFALASCSAAPEDDPVAAGRGDVTFVLQTPDMAPKTKLYTGDPGDDSIGLDVETIDNYIGSLDLYVFNTSGTLVWSSHVFSNDYEEISLAYHDLGTWSGAEYGLYDVIAVANLDKSPSGTNYTKITSRSALNNMLVCFGTDLSSCGTYVTASGTKLCESHAFSVFSEDGTGDFTPGTYHFPSQFVMVSPLRRIAVSSAAMSVTLSLERIVENSHKGYYVRRW